MKRVSAFAAAALGSALVFSGASGAIAAESVQGSTSSSGSSSGSGSSLSKTELIANAAAARDLEARHVINQTFQDAVLKAKTEFDSAMKIATTAEAKASALAARRFSVSSAIAARQNAITALEKAAKADGSSRPDRSKR